MRFTTVALAVFFALANAASAEGPGPREGWRIVETGHSYGDLVERVQAAVKGEGMLLVTQASASGGAKAQGITILGNRVIGVYRNDFARRMLEASIAAGIEAPIRFYVTENEDGTATLSYKTPSFVFSPYFDEGGEALVALAEELDGVFETIAKNATE
ncbi:DUF302 domain-containing protein [Rhizobiales bacterium]|uniref:DUF302 domain-containing protein n=1 Tax=Hongsoonwoonella zoysiae TaxID=2821844 RepID=UPI0015606DC2|nr:DUF302 domain-containing protein [Hongsoonwoonella zoysiae]NRG16330.1 DUF302 domain-containing protein [Hongsoonwoonella zoysiae]